jgi:hypothetical protein
MIRATENPIDARSGNSENPIATQTVQSATHEPPDDPFRPPASPERLHTVIP